MYPYGIHTKYGMNPSWIPGQCLSLHFFDVGLWEARPDGSRCHVVRCEALRKQTRWQRPLSIADSMKQKQVGGFRTELNWWMDGWIDGLTLTEVFFFTSSDKNSLHLSMQPQKEARTSGFLKAKQFPAQEFRSCFPTVQVGAGVLGCSFSQRGTFSMCWWSTMGLGAELLGSSSCNAARCL